MRSRERKDGLVSRNEVRAWREILVARRIIAAALITK